MYKVYFDLEATGLSKWYDRIVEIGAVIYYNDKCISEFGEFIKCDRKMSAGAARKNGILEKQLVNARPTNKVLLDFFQWIRNTCTNKNAQTILIAYNGFGYDLYMLFSSCHRWSIPIYLQLKSCKVTHVVDPLKWGKENLDTTKLERNEHGCSYSQPDIYKALFGKSLKNAHRAVYDARGLSQICEHSKFNGLYDAINCNDKKQCFSHIKTVDVILKEFNKGRQSIDKCIHKNNKNNMTTFRSSQEKIKRKKRKLLLLNQTKTSVKLK